jgi:DNA polymerase I-like protein with 3'-5' exonuclease and polymerase domains
MRVLAHASGDQSLAVLFAPGANGDVYREMAARVFSKKTAAVSDEERSMVSLYKHAHEQ